MGKPYTHLLKSRLRTSQVIALAGGAATLTLEVNPSYRHSFAAVEYYSDAEGTTVVSPTAGTETYTLVSPLLPNAELPFTDNVVNSADVCLASWAANVTTVKVVLASVDVATHCRLRFMGNIS
jgi:hypothetical protein